VTLYQKIEKEIDILNHHCDAYQKLLVLVRVEIEIVNSQMTVMKHKRVLYNKLQGLSNLYGSRMLDCEHQIVDLYIQLSEIKTSDTFSYLGY